MSILLAVSQLDSPNLELVWRSRATDGPGETKASQSSADDQPRDAPPAKPPVEEESATL